MDNIQNLYDEQYVGRLFRKRVMPSYPDFKRIKKIEIIPHKKNIWEKSYHVVTEYETVFVTKDGRTRKLPIFCTAHSSEPRRNVYVVLRYLWDHGFSKGNLTVPHPLFYSQRFRATFYRGVEGENLYHYIRDNERPEIEKIVIQAAHWFAKLHRLPTDGAKNFNRLNSRIATVVPGVKHILSRIERDYPDYFPAYREIYGKILEKEKKFLRKNSREWLIHGDAHPENFIKMSEHKIAAIDFTDLCLADFARDLGSFTQQLEFMIRRKIGDNDYVERIKNLFLKTYTEQSKIKLTEDLKERMSIYYYWTALRTATHFLMKSEPEPDRARGLLVQTCYGLKINRSV